MELAMIGLSVNILFMVNTKLPPYTTSSVILFCVSYAGDVVIFIPHRAKFPRSYSALLPLPDKRSAKLGAFCTRLSASQGGFHHTA